MHIQSFAKLAFQIFHPRNFRAKLCWKLRMTYFSRIKAINRVIKIICTKMTDCDYCAIRKLLNCGFYSPAQLNNTKFIKASVYTVPTVANQPDRWLATIAEATTNIMESTAHLFAQLTPVCWSQVTFSAQYYWNTRTVRGQIEYDWQVCKHCSCWS